MDGVELYGWYAMAAVIAASAGGWLYLRKANEPYPLTSKITTALAGGATGAFCGALFGLGVLPWLPQPAAQFVLVTTIATFFCLRFQRLIYRVLADNRAKGGA